ncbi:MAG TPA: RnfABCDGE type electron transport complex subunit D [Chloroflexi bacterium]|nr:RnfABCDGE type electron transport complex subunit D [Chloroflexota bacterium]
MSDTKKLVFSASPHLKDKGTVSTAMRDVFIALLPVTAAAIYFFRLYAVFLIAVSLITAVLTELLFRRIMNKKPSLHDWSALLTGLFVALLFPATTPWWTVVIATFIAVGIAKELMGGLGWNLFNPALFGRVAIIILAPWLAYITGWFAPLAVNLGSVDALTQATPLAMLHMGAAEMPPLWQLFVAYPGGALSEVSPMLLLIGAAYLFYRGHINWRIPLSILGTVVILTAILGQNPVYHICTGGIMIGAFFMATDWVTSPFTDRGKLIFGIAIGVLIVVFRLALAPTEGVAFAILIMNAFVPLIDRKTVRPYFGRAKAVAVE